MISFAACRTALAFAVAPLLLPLLEVLAASAGDDEGDTGARGDRADAAAWPFAAAATAIAGSLLNADAGELASESQDLLLLESPEPLGLATGRRSDAHAVRTCTSEATICCQITSRQIPVYDMTVAADAVHWGRRRGMISEP